MALNLETSPINDQIASAVLDLHGNLIAQSKTVNTTAAATETTVGMIDARTANILYQIFLEAGLLQISSFRRMTISSSKIAPSLSESVRYIISRDDTHIYVIAQKV
jgi:hypothetical protein